METFIDCVAYWDRYVDREYQQWICEGYSQKELDIKYRELLFKCVNLSLTKSI